MEREQDRRIGAAELVQEVFDGLPAAIIALDGAEQRIVAANEAARAGRDVIGLGFRETMPELASSSVCGMLAHVYDTGVPDSSSGLAAVPRRADDGRVVGVTLTATASRRRLLPAGLPVLPSVRLAGSHLPAAGGDWFDAVPLADGRVALVVGDIAGEEGAASADAGGLRAVLGERLAATGDVGAAVEAADRVAARMPGAYAATACVALLDPESGRVDYCTAGHPPPLLVGGDGARYLPVTGGHPLGTGAGCPGAGSLVETASIDLGDVLLLYTDGLVGRPDCPPAAATIELCRAAEDALAGAGQSAVDRACAGTAELACRGGYTDDITVLAAQRVRRTPPLHLRLPARADVVGAVRAEVLGWLRAQAVGEDDASDVVYAVSELVTNAVEHGTEVTVDARLTADGVAEIAVADDGHWHDRRLEADRHRGLGLAMTANLVDRVEVNRAGGTKVTVRRGLSHPARLLVEAGRVTPPGGRFRLRDRGDREVAVSGPLDAGNAHRLAREIGKRTFGGTHPLAVDLTEVTHLAGEAIAVLHRATAQGAANAAPLRVYASPGTVAQHACALAGLPNATVDTP